MKKNRLADVMNTAAPALNGWVTLGSTAIVETMAHQPWDSITIDMQHGLADFATVVEMLRAISTTSVTPVVRVPWLEPGIIQRVLDAGAYGVICPMINSAEECRQFVELCRYAPQGSRSFGPTRAPLYAGTADYYKHANQTVLTLVMIETTRALQNIDEIVAVPELNGVYIGPADLTLSLGFDPVADQRHPEVLAAIDRIHAAATRAGKFTFMHCSSAEHANFMRSRQFSALTVSSDSRMIVAAQQALFRELKEFAQRDPAATGADGNAAAY
ncbi:HpcH/HpaI aldolase/citrate lyase family protein [Herbaspirillum sp. NPDC087042]|uniref:HpcH/HpaI aldolase family protein n=1 Tax=Herbaspirillum sp. NPDC087042 TaxID=3364004 RepID=UPI0038229385